MNNDFAPFQKFNTSFIVKNIITESNKTVKIFNYPIPVGKERDLLAIPGVGESDIRASLLKGEILHKLKAKEIEITFSDIDLLQFNSDQKTFLQNSGIINGLSIGVDNISQDLNDYILSSGGTGGITPSQHETIRQLIHFIDNGPADGFASGAFKTIIPSGSAFPTNITWYIDNTQTKKIVEKIITYNINNIPNVIIWNMYDTDGTTIIHTITDTITYVNTSFESTRTRSIS